MLPFTREAFFAVFGQYNDAVWPAQAVAYLVGIAMVGVILLRPSRGSDRWVAAGLAAMWLWTGIGYHALQFTAINPAAYGFAALFVLQGLLFAVVAASRGTLGWAPPATPSAWTGLLLVVYAMLLYPVIGRLAGHEYPMVPMFGIAPCPVVIFTFGLLMMATRHVPRWLLAVPLLWALVGGSAAYLLGVPQDWMLLLSGLAAPWIVLRDRRAQRQPGTPASRGRAGAGRAA